ncbi:F-box protein [Actinidia chinensis var. chinensis]|uniref:F-box protein n=1 Tax=Actinidia chinensis var. chinensis TaxID=1590841 RepID=A0A2R6RWH1_ACTCC|nr:F-box protein [Actinidia chinensis var. chinensis]
MAYNGEILEVLSWLPAKSIFKFASVSKPCNEFLSDPFFIQKQLKNMLLKDDAGVFIQQISMQGYPGKLEFHALGCSEKNPFGIPLESIEFLKKTGNVLGSSNGLLICRDTRQTSMDQLFISNGLLICRDTIKTSMDQLFICNVATRTWLSIPAPESFGDFDQDLSIVFQCNVGPYEFPNDYLVMVMERMEYLSPEYMCKIYLSREREWQERGVVNFGARDILFQSSVYHNGVFHFLSDWFPYLSQKSPFYWPYIVAFDLEECTSRFIHIPKRARKYDLGDQSFKMGIFEWGKGKSKSICLVIVRKGVFSAWILSDYGSGSWTRILKNMHTQAMGLPETNPSIEGFKVFNGCSLLVATDTKVYLYDLTGDRRNRRAEEVCEHKCGKNLSLHSYSSTLRPCGSDAMPLPK